MFDFKHVDGFGHVLEAENEFPGFFFLKKMMTVELMRSHALQVEEKEYKDIVKRRRDEGLFVVDDDGLG